MKLFIPILCYNQQCHTQYMMSLMDLFLELQRRGISFTAVPITFDSLVSRARNAAVAMFLNDKDATHLLFIDSDIEFNKLDVLKLVACDLPVVGCAYAKKFLDLTAMLMAQSIGIQDPKVMSTQVSVHLLKSNTSDNEGLLEAEYITTGFLLIKKEVFDTLIQEYPKRKYINDIDGYISGGDNFYDFFSVSINPQTKRFESEDYGFSRLWRNAGGKIYVITDVTLKHHGWFGYDANLHQQMKVLTEVHGKLQANEEAL